MCIRDSAKAAAGSADLEPKWEAVTLDVNKTYVIRVRADFEAKTVSYRINEKATGKVLAQKVNAATEASGLARIISCSWWDSKAQYLDNFRLTAPVALAVVHPKINIENHPEKRHHQNDYNPCQSTYRITVFHHDKMCIRDRDFIGEAEFKLMQTHAILIHTARGTIVNKKALHEALRKSKIAGSGSSRM